MKIGSYKRSVRGQICENSEKSSLPVNVGSWGVNFGSLFVCMNEVERKLMNLGS